MSPITGLSVYRPEPAELFPLSDLMDLLRSTGYEPHLRWVGAQWFLEFGSFHIGAIDLRKLPWETLRFLAEHAKRNEGTA